MPSLNAKTVAKFYADGGEKTLRYTYDLSPDSLVIDLGGYVGDFAHKIHTKYKCHVEVYEPVKEFYEKCTKRFEFIDKVTIVKKGVSDSVSTQSINLMSDGTSLYSGNDKGTEEIGIVDIVDVIGDRQVDLIKINVEGSEFEIMERVVSSGIQSQVKNFQIQFHNFPDIKNPEGRRQKIRESLQKTHRITFDYPFVWENWQIK